ncbi:hypothetical protein E2C01_087449 [Portunus trituberculatus]|uniref:Tudor domain-containing protein n=1 Tax=Portunus trituberculatus TaxID=210409 RepID=A0A5B7JDE1_PORTR|nr:hypothetical protein [Portunus trituberculatus]
MVYHQEFWARGRMEGIPAVKTEKFLVFLLDYGYTVKEELINIVPVNFGDWTSVPYQAKKVCLVDVIPVSLQYSYEEEISLILKKSKYWDPAATRFVEAIFAKLPKTEFEPVTLNQEGTVH